MKAPKLTKAQQAAAGVATGAAVANAGVYLLLGLGWTLLVAGVLFAALCLLGIDTGSRR